MTVKSALVRFVKADHKWVDQFKFGPSRKEIPERVREAILSKEWLQSNAAYSLRERVFIIERDLGYKFNVKSLHRFYHENGIRFRKTRWMYRQANDELWKGK